MHYVISDIHGCYNEYIKALEAVDFNDDDILYVLGDCIDRGYASIKVLQDMMRRPNVIPFLGNHEYLAIKVLEKLCGETTEQNVETQIPPETMQAYTDWMFNGGDSTLEEFRALSLSEQYKIIDYLDDFSLYDKVCVNGQNYLLVHGGLEPFSEGMTIEDFSVPQLLFSRADLDRVYFKDIYTITGHTPTISEEGNKGTVIKRNNHISIDCGCVFGYNLSIYCLEIDKEIYIPYEFQI